MEAALALEPTWDTGWVLLAGLYEQDERIDDALTALERAREELLDFHGSGMSIMEHSHRGKEYDAVHSEAI